MPGKIKSSKKTTQLIPPEDADTKAILECLKNNVDYYDKQIKTINTYDDASDQAKIDELETIVSRFSEWDKKCEAVIEDEFEDDETKVNYWNGKLTNVRGKFTDKVESGNKKIETLKNYGSDSHARYGGIQNPGFDRRGSTDSNGGTYIDEDKFLQLDLKTQEEDAVNEAILREREEDITNINKQVHIVHDTFKDLAELVNEQQESVDTIANNVDQAHENTKEGVKQLEKAAEYQTSCIIS